ncbi:MAG: NAD(P)-dependent oxidoreductase [Acidimicrobiales bacterium]
MRNQRILITGAAGQLGFPVAVDLARENQVWGIARFANGANRQRLELANVSTASVDLADPDWQVLPEHFDYVLHFAADITGADFDQALRVNAEGTGALMSQYRRAKAILIVSSSVVYDLHSDPKHKFTETDALGDSKPLFGPTYSVSKIAEEAVARTLCRTLKVPTVIARMNLSYGVNGGLPAYQLDAILRGDAVTIADHETFHNPIFQDDVVRSVPLLLEAATIPATITNWGGNETVSMRSYCEELGRIVNREVRFEPLSRFMRSRAIDTTVQHALIGPCAVDWLDGMRLLVERRNQSGA